MSGALRKVQSGQKFEIPASQRITPLSTRRWIYAGEMPMSVRRHNRHCHKPAPSWFVNDSGNNLNRFAVLGIDAPIIAPTDNEKRVQEPHSSILCDSSWHSLLVNSSFWPNHWPQVP